MWGNGMSLRTSVTFAAASVMCSAFVCEGPFASMLPFWVRSLAIVSRMWELLFEERVRFLQLLNDISRAISAMSSTVRWAGAGQRSRVGSREGVWVNRFSSFRNPTVGRTRSTCVLRHVPPVSRLAV